jgi:hypothetical protein
MFSSLFGKKKKEEKATSLPNGTLGISCETFTIDFCLKCVRYARVVFPARNCLVREE